MSTSKPWTKSYFIKRLRDSGYVVDELFSKYSDLDCRLWSVVIDPGGASVIATCVENRYNYWESKAQETKNDIAKKYGLPTGEVDRKIEKYILLDDCGQFFPPNTKIQTQSMDVVIAELVRAGINTKSAEYAERCNKAYNEKNISGD